MLSGISSKPAPELLPARAQLHFVKVSVFFVPCRTQAESYGWVADLPFSRVNLMWLAEKDREV